MFCKNCGKQLSDNVHYCPKCGTRSEPKMQRSRQARKMSGNMVIQYKRVFFSLCIIFFIFAAIGAWGKKPSPPSNNHDKIESISPVTPETTSESQMASQKIGEGDVIGTWKCEAGEVTFTEKGNMMMGKDGIVLGGGWLKYEVADDSTLYLSGGDMPVGINMKYELDGDYLGLELNGETIVFVREE